MSKLTYDAANITDLLSATVTHATNVLSRLADRPAGTVPPEDRPALNLPSSGLGAEQTLDLFAKRYAPWMSGSAGPRYFGYVTGGVTPAALMGDWLTSVYDQNAGGDHESISPQLELDTFALLRQLFGLPDALTGIFVTGATMSNFGGLALARQWIGQQQGIDIAEDGLSALPRIRAISGTPHSSVYKALSMLGIGRSAIHNVSTLPDREAIDLTALEEALHNQDQQPCIVVANAGTVNTVDFDDLEAIAALKAKYNFWLHVDAAFGGFAACLPSYRHFTKGMGQADSLTIDAHKFLNVPYDAAMLFTRHLELQANVFRSGGSYLDQRTDASNFIHLTPENSRRLRALPALFSLLAYGREGYANIIDKNCRLAHKLGERIDQATEFDLLAPVRFNGLCFALTDAAKSGATKEYLTALQHEGTTFLTPTEYQGYSAIRISITNWQTTEEDVELAWAAMRRITL